MYTVRVSEMFTIQITFLKMFLQNFGKTMYYIVNRKQLVSTIFSKI